MVAHWFRAKFGEPTDPQRRGWPEIAAGRNTLIAAPTGSGKTLAAFLVCLDRLVRRWREGTLEDRTYVVYVSPLKALSNDIHRNLEEPLAELGAAVRRRRRQARCRSAPESAPATRRPAERAKMLRNPPHILVTTPESLYLLLTSAKSRELLRNVETVIVDEIHALVRDKRGSHLALSLERLAALCEKPPVRIGLSATQRPIEDIARFLVGTEQVNAAGEADCAIIDGGHARELDLAVEVPASELSAVCSNEQWAEIYARLVELVTAHRSTLIFVNTRRLAERVSHHLREMLGEAVVASHHGSLSQEIRQSAEERLKNGELRAIVATASLEMGIDIGYIDLVCQIGSTGSIATFLQRVGRAGHSLGKVPKGRLFPLTRDELLESLALVRAVRRGHLDAIEMPEHRSIFWPNRSSPRSPARNGSEDDYLRPVRRAWPYRNLSRDDFDAIVHMLSEGVARGSKRGRLPASRCDQQSAACPPRRTHRRAHLRRRDSRNGPLSRRRRAGGHVRRHGRRRLRHRKHVGRRVPAGQHVLARAQRSRRRSARAATPRELRPAFRSGSANARAARRNSRQSSRKLRHDLADSVHANIRANQR